MKILVVDDHQLFRKAFIRLLKISIEYPIFCDEAQSGQEAIDKLEQKKFDLVFLDVSMPRMDGVEAYKHIKNDHPGLPVIILTGFDNENLISHFVKTGVHSFLSKGASVDELRSAIESIGTGKKYFPMEIELIIKKMIRNRNKDGSKRFDFSCQEKLLMQFLVKGFTSKEIAEQMKLTNNTVRTYKERLMEKTNTQNVAELIAFGFKNGILN